jgi:hypothetical protein
MGCSPFNQRSSAVKDFAFHAFYSAFIGFRRDKCGNSFRVVRVIRG